MRYTTLIRELPIVTWTLATSLMGLSASSAWAGSSKQEAVAAESASGKKSAFIQILDHSVVNGTIKVAPGTNLDDAVYFSSTVDPTTVESLPRKLTLPTSIAAPADATDLGAIDLSGRQLALQPGVYKASSLMMTQKKGQETILYTTGAVKLYVEGSVKQDGGLLYGQAAYNSAVNQFSPADFQLFIVNTGDKKQTVNFESGLTAAVIFADALPITLRKNHILIGAAIGQSLEVEDASIYYPQTLSEDPNGNQVRFAVNSSSPIADLLWMRMQSVPLAGSNNTFVTNADNVKWNPGETPEQQASFWVWEPTNGGWWAYPGKPAGGGGPPGVGGEGGCFLAGTPILLASGTQVPIEQLKVGDMVMAYDQASHQFKPDAVKKLLIHPKNRGGYLLINGHLKVTPNHTVYSHGRWVLMGTLKVGDELFNAQGQPEPIRSIERVPGRFTVYNFEVNPYHTYIAGGVVVHNEGEGKGGPIPSGGGP